MRWNILKWIDEIFFCRQAMTHFSHILANVKNSTILLCKCWIWSSRQPTHHPVCKVVLIIWQIHHIVSLLWLGLFIYGGLLHIPTSRPWSIFIENADYVGNVRNVPGQWLQVIGRAVASNIRGSQFDSSHRQNLYWTLITIHCIERTKIKKNGPFKKEMFQLKLY